MIVAAFTGLNAGAWDLGGELGWWESHIYYKEEGTYDPDTGEYCTGCSPGSYTLYHGDPLFVLLILACALGVAVGLEDLLDPYQRGENASPQNRETRQSRKLWISILTMYSSH